MICTSQDEFVQNFNESNSRWQVTLNDNTTVFQDDGRPNATPHSAWIRLRNHCYNNSLYIVKMKFGFRSNMKSLPSNMEGYFFSKGAMGMFGLSKTIHLFLVGYIKNDKLIVEKWKAPEMIKQDTENRNFTGDEICLIRKNINQNLAQKI